MISIPFILGLLVVNIFLGFLLLNIRSQIQDNLKKYDSSILVNENYKNQIKKLNLDILNLTRPNLIQDKAMVNLKMQVKTPKNIYKIPQP
ncbi:MAG: hypothetical protein QM520_03400 [Gammaproteobacteria bacterium]|nr:hypothetical protein [Gammaproteobacteria bacterium]